MSSRLRTRLRAGTGLATASLSLEFATASGTLDPRITFSRGSQATLVDATGRLTYAPNNLLPRSEEFDNAAWVKENASITANSVSAPDGSITADTITTSAGAGQHRIYQVAGPISIALVFSIYAKVNTLSFIQLRHASSANIYANFDLNAGVIGAVGSSATASISAAGNGWYRCSIFYTPASSASNSVNLITSATAANSESWTAAGTESIYLWGAQLEQVTYQTTPGTYNSTSPKNLLGYTQEFDNAAWTKSNAFVQTNLVAYSQTTSDASWVTTQATKTSTNNSDPFGTSTALLLTSNGVSAVHSLGTSSGINISYVSGLTYTVSCWVKAGTTNLVQLTLPGPVFGTSQYANFLLDGAGSVTASSGGTATITAYGGGWYRITFSAAATTTTVQAGGALVFITSGTDGRTPTNTSTDTIYVTGWQLVQGSTAGDYQQTFAAAAAVQYTAPDGSRTADKVVENTASARHGVNQGATVVAGVYTASVYAKKGENDFLALAPGGSGQPNTFTWFNLATGAMGTNNNTSASMTDAGNGWYRCSITFTAIAGTLVPLVETSKANGSNVYTGDGTSGIYIWGAQLSNSASLDAYSYNPVAAPTSAAYYGPRFDYDPIRLTQKGLLIEEQRTNLLTYSEQFDNAAWVKTNATATANSILSPDGTTDADTITASAGAGYHYVDQRPAATAGVTYTASMYVKAGTTRYIGFGDAGDAVWHSAYLDTTNGAIISPTNCTATAVSVGSGWFRVTSTFTRTNAGSLQIYVGGSTATGTSGPQFTAVGTETCYAWGAQCEAGSFATSYIPTVASQVTRTADVALMQGANFSNWYNQNEGTFNVSFSPYQISASFITGVFSANDGSANNRIDFRNYATGFVTSAGSTQASLTTTAFTPYAANNLAVAVKLNDFAATANGGTLSTDTSGVVPAVNRLLIGGLDASSNPLNGHISRIGYYPTRLSNEQLQALTAQSTIPSLSLDFTTQVFNVG